MTKVRSGEGGALTGEYCAKSGVKTPEQERGLENVALLGGASPREIAEYRAEIEERTAGLS